jgi:hypothetical protein
MPEKGPDRPDEVASGLEGKEDSLSVGRVPDEEPSVDIPWTSEENGSASKSRGPEARRLTPEEAREVQRLIADGMLPKLAREAVLRLRRR